MWTMPARIVERFAMHRQARMSRGAEQDQHVREARIGVDRDDVGARHHDVVDPQLVQAEDVLEHRRAPASRSRSSRSSSSSASWMSSRIEAPARPNMPRSRSKRPTRAARRSPPAGCRVSLETSLIGWPPVPPRHPIRHRDPRRRGAARMRTLETLHAFGLRRRPRGRGRPGAETRARRDGWCGRTTVLPSAAASRATVS